MVEFCCVVIYCWCLYVEGRIFFVIINVWVEGFSFEGGGERGVCLGEEVCCEGFGDGEGWEGCGR